MSPRPNVYTHAGETLTLAEWAARAGVTRQAMLQRIRRWGVARAVTSGPITRRRCGELGAAAATAAGGRVRRIDPEDVRLITALKLERERLQRELGQLTDESIARKFGMSLSTVRRL